MRTNSCSTLPLILDLVRSWGLWLVIQSSEEAFGDQAFADTVDRAETNCHGLSDRLVVLALIGQQEDASMRKSACGGLALLEQAIECFPFLVRQIHTVLFHRFFPGCLVPAITSFSRNQIQAYLTIED